MIHQQLNRNKLFRIVTYHGLVILTVFFLLLFYIQSRDNNFLIKIVSKSLNNDFYMIEDQGCFTNGVNYMKLNIIPKV